MNTPAHVLVNLAVLGPQRPPREQLAVAVAAVAPDLPIFGFYALEKLLWQVPESQIWTDYFQPHWQHVFDTAHSIPLMIGGLLLAAWWRSPVGWVLCLSLLLHVAGDFPFHHDDAHAHFFPLSGWRFESPLSYWDPHHHGQVVGLLEVMAVAVCGGWVMAKSTWTGSKVLAGVVLTCYAGFLVYAWLVWG